MKGRGKMSPINPVVENAVRGAITVVGPEIIKRMVKYQKGNHGSKVKRGAYQDCDIEMFGDKACIVVSPDDGKIVLLTSDNIESCTFIKKKTRYRGLKLKDYYYYEIDFKNGEQSYVRMRKKYRNAMSNYTTIYKRCMEGD